VCVGGCGWVRFNARVTHVLLLDIPVCNIAAIFNCDDMIFDITSTLAKVPVRCIGRKESLDVALPTLMLIFLRPRWEQLEALEHVGNRWGASPIHTGIPER
jgi:hypothetical protein